MLQVVHDDIPVFFQDRQRNEQVEIAREMVCPQRLPESEDITPVKLTLIPYQKHAEEKEKVRAVG